MIGNELELESLSAGQRISSARLARVAVLGLATALLLAGCGADEQAASPPKKAPTPAAAPRSEPAPSAAAEAVPTPDSLPNALVLGLAQFGARQSGAAPKPLPATLEFISRRGGRWVVTSLTDEQSNVFHKAMAYPMPDGGEALVSAAGSEATLKIWTPGPEGFTSETIWQKDFGGKFSRMRDIEIADLYGDGGQAMAVATHDQGVVAVLRQDGTGGFDVQELDSEPNTFVHEIEIGDLDGDGVLEVYATPSEPNRLDGRAQSGRVVRYVPAKGEGRVVVADLGDRHAKEIFVDDVDGDGRDELYVIVEGHVEKETQRLTDPVEIRRYDEGTDPAAGVVIASIDDRLGRFLTSGDLDGDGKKEMVAALFSTGLWLLRPGSDPLLPWTKTSIDRDSGGFEHAAIISDLDADGRDELYVASDNDSEVRRYVWQDGRLARDVIYERTNGNSVFTWNIMPIPVELVPK